jgi:hypothetical protein
MFMVCRLHRIDLVRSCWRNTPRLAAILVLVHLSPPFSLLSWCCHLPCARRCATSSEITLLTLLPAILPLLFVQISVQNWCFQAICKATPCRTLQTSDHLDWRGRLFPFGLVHMIQLPLTFRGGLHVNVHVFCLVVPIHCAWQHWPLPRLPCISSTTLGVGDPAADDWLYGVLFVWLHLWPLLGSRLFHMRH